MTSHSPHIASDCSYKNINTIYRSHSNIIKSFAPLKNSSLTPRELLLLQRYLDATRSELFFASGVFLVEGVGEQFIIPAISKKKYDFTLEEFNVSIIPIHSRFFDPFLKLFQNKSLEITCIALIDGDSKECTTEDDETTAIVNAKALEVPDRVRVFSGIDTLEVDLFPDCATNNTYLKAVFKNLGHSRSYTNLIESTKAAPATWKSELLSRIDGTIKKGRFAQELSGLIDAGFVVPTYIHDAISTMKNQKAHKTDAE